MKEKMRKELLEKRNKLSADDVKKKSKAIIENLRKDTDYLKAKIVLYYVSKENEVYTHDLIRSAFKEKIVVVPKVLDNQVICCVIRDFFELRPGSYGVLEPITNSKIPVQEIQLVVVPGVAFDKKRYRLGYGKGFYDALLAKTEAKKIALAYKFQILDSLPHDPWDVRMDKVISD